MLDTNLRPLYQKYLINPLLRFPVVQNLSPCWLTLLACLFGISIALFLYLKWSVIAFIALLISGFLDTLDGSVARHSNKSSEKGAVLDISCDRLVEFAIILGLYFFDPAERALPALLMLGSVLLCITSFLVVGIFTRNSSEKSFFYSPGIIERTEAFILFGLMILIPQLFLLLSLLFSSLVFLTAGIRLWQFFYVKKNTI